MRKYFIESYRNKKNKPLSFFVNWLGLTLGLTAVIVIYLYAMQELRHDRGVFEDPMTHVYRVENIYMGAINPSPLAAELAKMPEVECAALTNKIDGMTLSTVDNTLQNVILANCLFSDTTLFRILPFKLISGTHESALVSKRNIVVSRSTAEKLFLTHDVIGRTIKINNQVDLSITGVFEDISANSTLRPDVICTLPMIYDDLYGSDYKKDISRWSYWGNETYIRLKPNTDRVEFSEKFANYVDEIYKRVSPAATESNEERFSIRPFNDIYLAGGGYSLYTHAKMIDVESINIMIIIAILILLIAVINYVNIYTARSTEVIRAMGIKTIMGAKRVQLIAFIIFDSIVITLLSAISAYILAWCLEPNYIDIIGEHVSLKLTWDLALAIFVAIPLVCGVISGVFPAITLTRMKPLDAMANRSSGNRALGYVRNGLIVFQFVISIVLIGSTLFINKQMNHVSSANLGYQRENILQIQGCTSLSSSFDVLRAKLLVNPNITGVCASGGSPVNIREMQTYIWGNTPEERYSPNILRIDENAFELFGLEMIEGEMLKIDKNNPDKSVIVNEAMAKLMRATNPSITFPFKEFKGVFKDFHASSIKEPVKPLAISDLRIYGSTHFNVYVKINGNDFENTLKFIENQFKELCPSEIYQSQFLDDAFNRLYQDDRLFRSRLLTFSILAIFISCLGLFALVSYSIERRRKEIAIRKVYGSTVKQILIMLTISFLRWLVVAFIIAAPAIYYISSDWISQFEYRTEMSWWIYGIALAVILLVALSTIYTQAYLAATENPAKNVKAE